ALRSNGQPLWVVQAFGTQNLWTSPVVADVNGDGRPDVIIAAEGFIRAFDGRTGAQGWNYYDNLPHYAAGAVGHFKADSSSQAVFIAHARGPSNELLSPSSIEVFNLDPTNLAPPWAMFRQDASGNAVARPTNSVAPLITKLYQNVLLRNPTASELNYWVGGFSRAQSLRPWIYAVTGSYEARGIQINDWYQKDLHRQAEAGGMAGWQAFLANGNSYNTAKAGIIASTEAFNNAGGTNSGWVTYLYQTLLGRTPGPGEADGWVNLLNTGQLNRWQLVPRFQGAPQTVAPLITGW